jgi:hypothetical protein
MYSTHHPADDSEVELELTEKENLEMEILNIVKDSEKKNAYQGNQPWIQMR